MGYNIDKLISQLCLDISEQEDFDLLKRYGISTNDFFKHIISIRFKDDKRITIKLDERRLSKLKWLFIFEYRTKHKVIEQKYFDDLLEGIEYFANKLENDDFTLLWNWFLTFKEKK